MTDTRKLDEALNRAQANLRAIDKDGRGNRGEYVSVDTAVTMCRDALHAQELTLSQTGSTLKVIGDYEVTDRRTGVVETKPGFVLQRTFRLAHSSGEARELSQEWPVRVDSSPIDHSVAAADSFGLTYLLRDLLMFARGEDFDTSDRFGRGEPRDFDDQIPPDSVAQAAGELGATVSDRLQHAGAWVERWRWEAPSVDDLHAFDDETVVDRRMAADMHAIAREELGSEWAAKTWADLGVDEQNPPTGRTARLYAAALVAAL